MRVSRIAVYFAAIALARCTCEEPPAREGEGEEGEGEGEGEGENVADAGPALDAFDVWREMQDVLRRSTDHREMRARALIDDGDPIALWQFVRDEIALVPGLDGFYGSEVARRWGTRATLRGGMGTMRERADLLADLLTQAGLEAEVWAGAPDPQFSLEAALAHAPVRAVSWDVDDATRDRWRTVLSARDGDPTRVAFDPDAAVQTAVADDVLAHAIPAPPAHDLNVTAVPFVRVTDGADVVDYNPNAGPLVAAGESRTLDPTAAPAADALDTVTVRLEAARAARPQEPFVLVEHTWSADELVGRTVTASFAPPLSFAQAADTKALDVATFVPVLAVRGADLSRQARADLSAVGAPFTRGGELLVVHDDGSVAYPDGDVPPPPSDQTALARVTDVSASADAATYPLVTLEVALADSDGVSVPGLAADAFSVREDGALVVAHLLRVTARAPRVLLLFDRSASLPPEFLDDAPAVGHAIADAVFAAVPGSEIQVGGLDFGAPTLAGGFSNNLVDVDAALTQLTGNGSEIWLNLSAVAENTPATVVVCISDFAAEDVRTAALDALIADGPPVLAVGVGTVEQATADTVAALSGGAAQTGTSADDVATAVAAFTLARAGVDYTLAYRARSATGVHDVTVGVDDERVSGATSFTAPDAPVRPAALSGLFLTVETRGKSTRRVLAGTDGPDVTDAHLGAVNGMLFGRAVLAIEAGAPSLSAKLDELIAERFVFEPIVDAVHADDLTALRTALAAPRTRTPARLRFLFSTSPADATGPVTYADGVQLALAIERPQFGVGMTHQVDLLPLVERRTALLDPMQSQEATVRRTAYLAAIEALSFSTSTFALLDGATLAPVDPLTADTVLGPEWLAPLVPYRDGYTILAPTEGVPLAFWAVRNSGALVGGLPDGSGGGIESEAEQTMNEINTVLDIAERAGEMAGFEGISVWVALERLKASLVLNATVIIAGGEGSDPFDIVADAACEAAEDAFLGAIPGVDELTGPIEDLGSIYDATEAITGTEMPPVDVPSACP